MSTLYAMSDIHGQRAGLDAALDRIHDEAPEASIVFVGDFIDRGPDSRGVVERLMQGQAEGRAWTCLQGNHDTFLGEFLDGPDADNPWDWIGHDWLTDAYGGRATLASYGVDADPRRRTSAVIAEARDAVPQAHRDWLSGLPRMHRTDDHVFVHAGIRPGVPLDKQDPADLIWIRRPFLESRADHGPLVVHGHTPVERPTHYGNRLNLDGGAAYGRVLHPVRLLGRKATLLIPGGGEVAL